MKANDISAKKNVDIRVDALMDKDKQTVLFPKKLLLANESIMKSGPPLLSDKKDEKTNGKM